MAVEKNIRCAANFSPPPRCDRKLAPTRCSAPTSTRGFQRARAFLLMNPEQEVSRGCETVDELYSQMLYRKDQSLLSDARAYVKLPQRKLIIEIFSRRSPSLSVVCDLIFRARNT